MNKRTLENLEFFKIVELLCECTNSNLGKEQARNIKIRTDINDVLKLQDETEEAKNILISGVDVYFDNLEDVEKKLKLAKLGSIIDAISILKIANNLKLSRNTKNKIIKKENIEILRNKAEELYVNADLEKRIFDSIISENEISDNASDELLRIRREIKKINSSIRTKLNQIITSQTNAKYFQDAIITQRQDRYVIPIKSEYKSLFPGIVHDTSSSGATLFIEPMMIVEMNNNLRIFKSKEKEEIEKILLDFTLEIGAISEEILLNQKNLAYMDFVFGKAKLALKLKAIYPKINDKNEINLKNARHPLLNVEKLIPLNIHIGEKFNILVITGPNTGGKTVTLKTVGLFSLMIQAGLQIPCDYGSKISVFKNIFSDIGDDQSISQNLSTFSSHMTNIVRIIKKADEKSLLLLDELGSGTDPDEGSALAISILEYLKNKKSIVIATTHYSNLKSYAINTSDVENASVEFDIETLSPTYNLLIGIPGKSNAFHISKKLGLRHDIIENAKSLLNTDILKMEDLLLKIEKNRKVIEKEKQEIQRLKEEQIDKLRAIEKEEEKLNKKKEKLIYDSKKEARKIINFAKEESNKIIEDLKNKKLISLTESKNKFVHLENKLSEEKEIIEKSEENLNINDIFLGQIVYIESFGKNATVENIDKKKKIVVVQIDNMKINLPITSISKSKEEKEVKKYTGSGKITTKKVANISQEIDVRGLDLEIALEKVKKYLDDAYLSNLLRVRIIHGIGNRILKNGISKNISNIKYIKNIKEADNTEGGAGATVVSFVDN